MEFSTLVKILMKLQVKGQTLMDWNRNLTQIVFLEDI